jgi:hypothetical protein
MNTSICAKYQTNKVENIQQKHADALKRINTRVKKPESVLTINDIEEIFKIIDDVFFSKQIEKILKSKGVELKFDINSKFTSIAGYCKQINSKKYILSFSAPIMKKLFSKDEKRYEIGGLQCSYTTECIYHVICHELIHLIVFIECPEMTTSKRGHNGIFKKMIKNIFGHTTCHHMLHEDIDTRESRTTRAFEAVKTKFKVGDTLATKAGKRTFRGQIMSIGSKRVKILTSDKKIFYISHACINDGNDNGNGADSDNGACLKKDAVQPAAAVMAPQTFKPIKCTTLKNVKDCGSNEACSWSSKTNKCSKTRVYKNPQTQKRSKRKDNLLSTASGCMSYTAEPECIESNYNCVWGKTKRCSKKRTRPKQ